jgi:hypothetical protein
MASPRRRAGIFLQWATATELQFQCSSRLGVTTWQVHVAKVVGSSSCTATGAVEGILRDGSDKGFDLTMSLGPAVLYL